MICEQLENLNTNAEEGSSSMEGIMQISGINEMNSCARKFFRPEKVRVCNARQMLFLIPHCQNRALLSDGTGYR